VFYEAEIKYGIMYYVGRGAASQISLKYDCFVIQYDLVKHIVASLLGILIWYMVPQEKNNGRFWRNRGTRCHWKKKNCIQRLYK